jgi:hypothetical protein
MTVLLDAGALVALERGGRLMWGRLETAHRHRIRVITHGGVLAQVWRGGRARQSRLAVALTGVTVAPLDEQLGRRAGLLLAATGLSDAVDAALAALANHGDVLYTSDPDDLGRLVAPFGRRVDVVPV